MKIEINFDNIHTGWRFFGFDKNNVPIFGRLSYDLLYTNEKGEQIVISQDKPLENLDDRLRGTIIKTIEPEKVDKESITFNVGDIIKTK